MRKRLSLPLGFLPQPDLDECLNAASIEFSKFRTNRIFGLMPIIAQQIDYAFPTGLEELIDFFYAPQTILGNLSFEEEVLMAIQGNVINIDFGGNIFENPSLVSIWFDKMNQFRNSIGLPVWRVMENPTEGPLIRLGTIPSENGTAYWEGKAPWTIGEIYAKDFECFKKAVLWKVSEWRANNLAVSETYSEGDGIRVTPATARWDKQAAIYREEFLLDVGYYKGVFTVG